MLIFVQNPSQAGDHKRNIPGRRSSRRDWRWITRTHAQRGASTAQGGLGSVCEGLQETRVARGLEKPSDKHYLQIKMLFHPSHG